MAQRFKDRYNEVDVQDVIDDYVNGKKSCLTIAVDYDYSPSAIRSLLLKNDITLRPQGRQKTRIKTSSTRRRFDPNGSDWLPYDKILEGIERYKNNLFSLMSLSLFWDCSVCSARKILMHHNVKRHDYGWRAN